VFCREWCTSLLAGKGREGEGRADPPFLALPAAAREPTRHHEFLQFLKHFLCSSWSFEDCFVKFELFDVIFIYFLIL
jgi:hypothetical protein